MTLEEMVKELEATGKYRVLKKIEPRTIINPPDSSKVKLGLYVDVETTGLDTEKDEIIELSMVPFTYSIEGKIFEVKDFFQAFRQPSTPIPKFISEITGITNEDVKGCSIDVKEVEQFIEPVSLVIAHKADFDRKVLERFCKKFAEKPWACSMTEINWKQEGYEGVKLSYLLNHNGLFYDRHRAYNDCIAAIELLTTTLPKSGELALKQLLSHARTVSYRIWAENTPYNCKDILKELGYKWSNGEGSDPKAWYKDVDEKEKDGEILFLEQEIYKKKVNIRTTQIDAYNRFSNRV